MNLVNQYTYTEIVNLLLTKTVHFVSDCEFFPNFDIIIKIIEFFFGICLKEFVKFKNGIRLLVNL